MRQEAKSQISRDRILQAASEEFGKKGYDGASLNVLLIEHGLSKGLVYHYFENKEQLYLACVQKCFDALSAELSGVDAAGGAEEILSGYFEARGRFFQRYPQWEHLFFDALLFPPAHLAAPLREARAGFDVVNRRLFRAVLAQLPLREGVTERDALDYFGLMQDVLHLCFASARRADGAGELAGRYETRARNVVEFLLYGLVGRRE